MLKNMKDKQAKEKNLTEQEIRCYPVSMWESQECLPGEDLESSGLILLSLRSHHVEEKYLPIKFFKYIFFKQHGPFRRHDRII